MFGSRAKSIKDVLLGKELPQPLEFSKKRSRSVKIVKRDSRSIRTVRIMYHYSSEYCYIISCGILGPCFSFTIDMFEMTVI